MSLSAIVIIAILSLSNMFLHSALTKERHDNQHNELQLMKDAETLQKQDMVIEDQKRTIDAKTKLIRSLELQLRKGPQP